LKILAEVKNVRGLYRKFTLIALLFLRSLHISHNMQLKLKNLAHPNVLIISANVEYANTFHALMVSSNAPTVTIAPI